MAERKTQAQWDAERAEAKAEAAKVIKANAAKALKARNKALGLKADGTRVQGTPTEVVTEENVESLEYSEWTNDELSAELKSRELPHSGNKDELIARLKEADSTTE